MLQPSPVEIDLGRRAYWLIQLRWVASSAIIYGAFVVTSVVGIPLDPVPLYIVGAAIAACNSLYVIGLKWSEIGPRESHLRAVRLLTNGQIATDLLFLTVLIHFAGGVENPLSFYFIFHVIIASILLSRWEAFLQATWGCTLYGALLLGELSHALPHVHLLGPTTYDLSGDPQFVVMFLVAFVSTLYLAAYLATSIVAHLRRRSHDVVLQSAELERKAQRLEVAYSDLAELEQMKSEYLRKVSHEIKPPLAAIQTWLRELLDGLAGEVPVRQGEIIARAERQTHELLALVADLLVLSRVREGKLFTDRQMVSLTDVVEKVVAAEAAKAAAAGVSVSTQLASDVQPVSGDPDALEQLVGHLVSNAVKYTLNGGKVEARVDCPGDVVQLQVVDTGIGIPSADLGRIFNEFFRSENARRYSKEGTGLGLSIAHTIVENHGGRIEVESQVGIGSKFTVILPAAQPARILAPIEAKASE